MYLVNNYDEDTMEIIQEAREFYLTAIKDSGFSILRRVNDEAELANVTMKLNEERYQDEL